MIFRLNTTHKKCRQQKCDFERYQPFNIHYATELTPYKLLENRLWIFQLD
jgi:hypothetical protein